MHLVADRVFAEPKDDDAPCYVGFDDRGADYCLYLSRFSDLEPDEGTIEIMVQDQMLDPHGHPRSAVEPVALPRRAGRGDGGRADG